LGRSSGEAGILLHPSGWTILHRHMEFSENTCKATLKPFITALSTGMLSKGPLSPKIDKRLAVKYTVKGQIPRTRAKL
jgi:hypothetical protein